MDNPWIRLPQSPPFVLQEDRSAIDRFNARATELHQIHLELIPEPFLGRPDAPIVLLNLNPGFDSEETRFHHSDSYFIEQSRKNLLHSPIRYPFYLLNPELSQSLGHQWWRRKLKAPIAIAGVDKVASRVLCIEYFPYHTKRYKKAAAALHSQGYSFSLARQAIQRNALIVIMRSRALWMDAVPELARYARVFELRNPQNVSVSPRNCPEGYPRLEEALLA